MELLEANEKGTWGVRNALEKDYITKRVAGGRACLALCDQKEQADQLVVQNLLPKSPMNPPTNVWAAAESK
jgi:hypothetical protein